MITSVTIAGAEAGPEVLSNEIASPEAQAAPTQTNSQAEAPRFDSLGLSETVLKAVTESGYTVPTPIQAQGIPVVLQRRDLIGIAQTGTGKTASFTLPMIELLSRGRAKARMPRSLILEPTRELAAQVAESFEKYGKYNKLSMALLIGGVSFDEQDRKLDRGVDVLIATPGRLMDHFSRGKLMLSQVNILVVDEADRMLDMGFIPDVEEICKKLPFTRQTLFYSATMPPEIQRLTDQFLHNPVRVEVARPATTAANIVQEVIEVPGNDWAKREALRRLIREAGEITNAIVFCNRKRDVDVVAKSLSKHGFNAAPLHGDLDQSVRTRTLDGFRSGALTILVASDVAARGLDIPAVSHVFNFDAPFHADDYVHRIGRTGRAGRSGHTYMLASSRDAKYVEAIEKLTGNTLVRRTMEGLAEAVQARPAGESRGHGRDRSGREGGRGGRERGGRGQHNRPIKDHGQRASMEPSPAQAAPAEQPAVVAVQPAPMQAQPQAQKPRQDHRREHRQQQHKPQQPKQQQPQHNEPKKPDAHQLPAFLMRPVNLPKPVEKPAKAKKAPAEA
jgi:superfamily II DNA/RNA helicase